MTRIEKILRYCVLRFGALMSTSPQDKYGRIVSALVAEFWSNNKDALKKEQGAIEHDLIDRGLSGSTIRPGNLLALHYKYLKQLIDFLIVSIEKNHPHLRPSKCKKLLLQVIDDEYGKLKRKVPGWLVLSRLPQPNIIEQFQTGVTSKKNEARESLEHQCVSWEDRWRHRPRWYKEPKWIIATVIPIIGLILTALGIIVTQCRQEMNDQVKTLKVASVDPNTGKTVLNVRTKERVEELKQFIIKEKIDPWLFMWHQSFKVTKHDGAVLTWPNLKYAGSIRTAFLSEDYIDPFLVEGIERILRETGLECRANNLRADEPLKEAQALLAGIIRNIYSRIAEVDSRLRQKYENSEAVGKVDLADRVRAMDEKLREHLQAALVLYSDSSD